MSRSLFRTLVTKLSPDLERDDEMGKRCSDGAIPTQVRVGIAIRLLAGGSAMDLMQLFHIPDRSINLIFTEVLSAIHNNLSLPGIPTTTSECRWLAQVMKDSRPVRSPWHGCIGAIDGIAIKILKPREEELPRNFRSRKGFFALPLQCVVDGKYRILSFSLRCTGSTHDNMLFDVSNLSSMLQAGAIPFPFWIVGDEA